METYRCLDDRSMDDVYESIRNKGYTVISIWECKWRALKACDPDVAQFTRTLNI